ncbi:MAG TPA: hypothetical protein VEB70_10325 [Noviherbaspirillum sp.]|nr:hypothetical protein [Noviherbaspirillum sp.]
MNHAVAENLYQPPLDPLAVMMPVRNGIQSAGRTPSSRRAHHAIDARFHLQ